MIRFKDTIVSRQAEHRITLSAETWVEFDHSDDETVAFGTPQLWDNALTSLLGTVVDVYEIHVKKITLVKCNRVTDYKKVWGLLDIPQGLFCNQFDNESERMYYGMSLINYEQFLHSKANTFVIIPKDEGPSAEEIWDFFKQSIKDTGNFVGSLQAIPEKWSNTITLQYSIKPDAELNIICQNSKGIEKGLIKALQIEDRDVHERFFSSI